MGFDPKTKVRDFTISSSQSMTIPNGSYVEFKMIGGGGAGVEGGGTIGAGGGDSNITCGTTDEDATGGAASLGTFVVNPIQNTINGFGMGGLGDGPSFGSRCGHSGMVTCGSFTADSTTLTLTVGAGGAAGGTAEDSTDGVQGVIVLRIWPDGQPNDGLPSHP